MKNRKQIAIASLTLSTILLLSGCNNQNVHQNETSYVYTDYDLNNFAKDDELKTYYWYVMETFDGDNYDIQITRKTASGNMSFAVKEYYYINALNEDYHAYAVLYNKDENTFWVENGPEIISAVPLTSYLDKYNLRKASYSKKELEDLLEEIKEEYQNEKELISKGKVLVKNNSMY